MQKYQYKLNAAAWVETSNVNGLFAVAAKACRNSGDFSEVRFIAGGGLMSAFYRSDSGTEIQVELLK